MKYGTGSKTPAVVMSVIGLIVVVWLGLLAAPAVSGGILAIAEHMSEAISSPFDITICEDTPHTVGALAVVYAAAIGVYLSSLKNKRAGEEHGSAKWGSAAAIRRKYASRRRRSVKGREELFYDNKLLTQNTRIGFDVYRHRHNLNVLVIGGSGAAKTRGYCEPNVMQANTSMLILDPKGEITRHTGQMLIDLGYDVKVFDLINMDRSCCYNPFVYIKDDNDVQRLVTNLFLSTAPKGSPQSADPFWDNAAKMLLSALVFYVVYESPPHEQNFAMVMKLLLNADVDEDGKDNISVLDMLFDELKAKNPNHIACEYYRSYRSGAGKTLKSINITLAARLEKFNMASVAALTAWDQLDLASMGESKTALFVIIPDDDTSFNFLVSILYTQLFQQLFYTAEYKHGGTLPVHVHFIMDEFANVSLPDDFEKILSVMRSRGVSASIILQNLAQLKALFEKQWESIVGNCDEFLYLGGNEASTHEYVSKLMGKGTIDTNSYGQTKGERGSYSTNYQLSGRELMTPDEVRMLDNDLALLFIRGEPVVIDRKLDLMKHPRCRFTSHRTGKPYVHGADVRPAAVLSKADGGEAESLPEIVFEDAGGDGNWQVVADADMGAYIASLRKGAKGRRKGGEDAA